MIRGEAVKYPAQFCAQVCTLILFRSLQKIPALSRHAFFLKDFLRNLVLVKVVSFIAVIVVGYLPASAFRAEDFRLIAGLVSR